MPRPKEAHEEEEEKRESSRNSARSHAQPQIFLSRLESGLSNQKLSHDNHSLHPFQNTEHAGERGRPPKQQSSELRCQHESEGPNMMWTTVLPCLPDIFQKKSSGEGVDQSVEIP